MTTTTDFDDSILDDLADQLRGVLLRPDDDGYDDARAVWNGRFDARPDVVVRTHGTADVVAAVDFARDEDLRVSVDGGGHDYAGNAVRDGGLLIDLSPMDAVRVDPDAETARVEPGGTGAVGRPDRPPVRGGDRSSRVLSLVHGRRTGRGQLLRVRRAGTAAPGVPGGATR